MEHADLVGKTFEFVYSDETYRIEVLSRESIRWTRTKGKNTGQSDTEAYVFSRLDDTRFMLSWVEADGLGLSNVLNPTDGRLTTHASMKRDVFVNSGRLNSLT